MNLEASLNYVTVHSQSIIQWVFLVIVLLVGILIAHALFGRRETEVASGVGVLPSAEVNAALARLLEQNANGVARSTNAADATADHAAAPAGDGHAAESAAAPSVEIEGKLKKMEFELRARDEELAKLRAGDQSASAAAPGGMADRLHELETKLAEYEILEDDIADLSLYKEENSRLRAELEAIRGDGDGDSGASAAPPPPAAPAARTGEPDDFAPAQPARTAVAAAEAAASLAAFDEPVAAPAPAAAAPPVVVAAEFTPEAAASAADEPVRHDLTEGADDLFAEFATALEESGVDLSSDAPKGETGT